MKLFTFHKEDNDFDEILKDPSLKTAITYKVSWNKHLIVGMTDEKSELLASYITIKYGEMIVDQLVADRTPIEGVDYIDTNKPRPE